MRSPKMIITICLLLLSYPVLSQFGTPFNQRDDEYRLLGLKRAKGAFEAAKAEYERQQDLFEQQLVSANSLEESRRNFSDAEVNYQQSLLAVLFEQQYVSVESAVKYQAKDGRKHVRLSLKNASGGSAEYRKLLNIDDALFRSLQPDVVNNVYVSLLNDGNAIISQPNPRPVHAAMLVDVSYLPVTIQSSERKTRPPSIGNAGIMLKMASAKFVMLSHNSITSSE